MEFTQVWVEMSKYSNMARRILINFIWKDQLRFRLHQASASRYDDANTTALIGIDGVTSE